MTLAINEINNNIYKTPMLNLAVQQARVGQTSKTSETPKKTTQPTTKLNAEEKKELISAIKNSKTVEKTNILNIQKKLQHQNIIRLKIQMLQYAKIKMFKKMQIQEQLLQIRQKILQLIQRRYKTQQQSLTKTKKTNMVKKNKMVKTRKR